MKPEESIADLKKEFAKRFSHATLTITIRIVKGKKCYYFKTVGAYKVDSGRLLECYFDPLDRYREDYNTLTYYYRAENEDDSR